MKITIKRLIRPFLSLWKSDSPASVLIRNTAKKQWRWIFLNIISSLSEALTEGLTLGIVFLTVQLVTDSSQSKFDWNQISIFNSYPQLTTWLNEQPTKILFVGLLILAVAFQALQSISIYLNKISVGYFSARCRSLVTQRIHSQVLSFSYPCASSYKIGDLIDHTIQGADSIRIQLDKTSSIVVSLFMSLAYLFVLIGISPWLFIVVIGISIPVAALQKSIVPRIKRGAHLISSAQVQISSLVTEDFQGLRLLHSTGQLANAKDKVTKAVAIWEPALRRQARRLAVTEPLLSFIPILAIAIIGSLSIFILDSKNSSVVASLATFVVALQRLNKRTTMISNDLASLADNAGKIDRLNSILSVDGKQFRRNGGKKFNKLTSQIEFKDVSLTYQGCDVPALKSINVRIDKGKKVALVGSSGSGKSSLADILVGLYSPTSGKVCIDQISIMDLDLNTWQNRIGVVSQDTFLFNASIKENIAFGTKDATNDQIMTAANLAQASSFIDDLPYGYETKVGERGYRLSGGQRQRLSLARALLKNPELLILDEATSALDSQSERLVQEAIDSLDGSITMLIIAHRLSTITSADEILVMGNGSVLEHGNHESLLRNRGAYYQLWSQQTQAIS